MNIALKLSLFAAFLGSAALSGATTLDRAQTPQATITVAEDGINPQPLPPRSGHQPVAGRQFAGATDIRHCAIECTPEGGCQYVCYHLMY
jgi:hypothetical protein